MTKEWVDESMFLFTKSPQFKSWVFNDTIYIAQNAIKIFISFQATTQKKGIRTHIYSGFKTLRNV